MMFRFLLRKHGPRISQYGAGRRHRRQKIVTDARTNAGHCSMFIAVFDSERCAISNIEKSKKWKGNKSAKVYFETMVKERPEEMRQWLQLFAESPGEANAELKKVFAEPPPTK